MKQGKGKGVPIEKVEKITKVTMRAIGTTFQRVLPKEYIE